MIDDPYLQAIAILVSKGFRLKGEIWQEMPWEGDMPDEFIEIFATIHRKLEYERIQQLQGV